MYQVSMLVQVKIPEGDEVSIIEEYYREVLKRKSLEYTVLDIGVRADKNKNFGMFIQLDIPEEEEKEKSVFSIVRELEEYYKNVLKEASSQFGGAKINTVAGKADETI